MRIVVRRVFRAVGWLGVLYLLLGAGAGLALLFHALPLSDAQAWRSVIVVVLGAAVLGSRMRGYRESQAVRSQEEVLPALLASGRQFCLVLRPFGQDGETFLRRFRRYRSLGRGRRADKFIFADIQTMEQVIAAGARQALRLVGRAYTIILWLAPGQDLRASFAWEVEQIVRAGRQLSTVIVLPPPDQQAAAYQQAAGQAAVLLAALDSPAGSVAAVDQDAAGRYRDQLGGNTVIARFQPPDGPGAGLVLRRWYATGGRKWWGGRLVLDAGAYEDGLARLMAGPGAPASGSG